MLPALPEAPTPTADLESVDHNLMAIRQIEGSWTQPPLPDQVKLDIATSGMPTEAVTSLLYGVDDAMQAAARTAYDFEPRPESLPLALRSGAFDPEAQDQPFSAAVHRNDFPATTDAGLLVGGLTGGRAWSNSILNPEGATSSVKQRLARNGYLNLSSNDQHSNLWLPEYTYAARQMAWDDMAREFQGNRPGAMSIETAFSLVEKWLSPKGLFDAAVNLDLFWDESAVIRETQSWGNKFRDWFDDPLSPGKFIDAITGPMDDIIAPVLNWALILSGVGNVAVTSRALSMLKAGTVSDDAIRAVMSGGFGRMANIFEPLASASRHVPVIGRGMDTIAKATGIVNPLDDIARFKQHSLASAIFGAGDPAATGFKAFTRPIGLLGQGWREKSSVVMMKKFNQQAFRLGFASNLESLVDDERGQSLATLTDVDKNIQTVFANPVMDWGVDLLLYPTNIFSVGAFRLAGAAARPGWTKMIENEGLMKAFADGVQEHLEAAGDMARAAQFSQTHRRSGLKAALSEFWGVQSDEELSELILYNVTSYMIDAEAATARALQEGNLFGINVADRGFHVVRDAIRGNLTYLDENDIEGFVDATAAFRSFSPTEGGFLEASPIRSEQEFRVRRNQAREMLMESPSEAAARGGKPREGTVRVYGAYDQNHSLYWTLSGNAAKRWMDDPLFVDMEVGELSRLLATDPTTIRSTPPTHNTKTVGRGAVQPDLEGGTTWFQLDETYLDRFRYGEVVSSSIVPSPEKGVNIRPRTRALPRLSQARSVRGYSPVALDNMREAIRNHNANRATILAEMMGKLNPRAFSAYVARNAARMDSYGRFSELSHEVRRMAMEGHLDLVTIQAPMSRSGRPIMGGSPTEWGDIYPKPKAIVTPEMEEAVLREWGQKAKRFKDSMFSPLVRSYDSNRYNVTIAHKGDVKKQEFISFAAEVDAALADWRAYQELYKLHGGRSSEVIERRRAITTALDEALASELPVDEAVNLVIAQLKLGKRNSEKLRRLARAVKRHGVSFPDLEDALRGDLVRLRDDPAWSTSFMVSSDVPTDISIDQLLLQRRKELIRRSTYVSSRLDNVPPELRRVLDESGYELVYGKAYLQPDDVRDLWPGMGQLPDMSKWRSRQVGTLGWFTRDAEGMKAAKDKAIRLNLHASISESIAAGKAVRLQLGDSVFDDSGDLTRIYDDLRTLLHDRWDRMQNIQEGAEDLGRMERIMSRGLTQRNAMSIEYLPGMMGQKNFLKAVEDMGYTHDEAQAIATALARSKRLGFKNIGLLDIEMALRANPTVRDGLRLLGRQKHVNETANFLQSTAVGGTRFAGAFAGAGLATAEFENRTDGDTSMFERLPAFLLGGAVGLAGSTLLVQKLGRSSKLGRAVTGGGIRAATPDETRFLTRGLAKTANRYEHVLPFETMANIRDTARFSLSPLFDLSRYGEAWFMPQIANLPEGVRLKANQSARSYRAGIARDLRSRGMAPPAAKAEARRIWKQNVRRFQAAARGDFEAEALDTISARFTSIGVMGYNPLDWMASSYAHLIDQGVGGDKAYEVVRDIYTYGVQGRSAAELSMNFVFFPFSYTKKVVSHMARFFQEDLGRLVVMQDAFDTWQALNENYDLTDFFKDRIPVLQRLQRINPLGYGISLGQFGGVNASIIGAARNTPYLGDALYPAAMFEEMGIPMHVNEIQNLFIPQLIKVNTMEDADNLWEIWKGALPVVNDIHTLATDLGRSYDAKFGFGLSPQAQVSQGYAEWREFQNQVRSMLASQGLTWDEAVRESPEFKDYVNKRKVDLMVRYPKWVQALGDGVASGAALDMEKNIRLTEATSDPNASRQDQMLYQFDQYYEGLNTFVQNTYGLSFNSDTAHLVPPETYDLLRKLAARYVEATPEFLLLYKRFYERALGPIDEEMVSGQAA